VPSQSTSPKRRALAQDATSALTTADYYLACAARAFFDAGMQAEGEEADKLFKSTLEFRRRMESEHGR
jgi:hypothetical protein